MANIKEPHDIPDIERLIERIQEQILQLRQRANALAASGVRRSVIGDENGASDPKGAANCGD